MREQLVQIDAAVRDIASALGLADDTIVSLLARQGIHIARRTVAKYREMLHIASAKERREPGPTSHTSLRANAPMRHAQ